MSEQHPHDLQPAYDAPESVDLSAQALASARRRHFIKMGAGALPVGLTLASRPVLATSCMSASAWGSTVGVAQTTSQYTRAAAKAKTISGAYTLSQWKSASPACGGWTSLGLTTTRTTYTVGALCGSSIPTGLTSTSTVWGVLTGTGTTLAEQFQRAMIVAWLNFKVSAPVNACLTDPSRPSLNQLTTLGSIGSAGGTGPDGKQWSQQTVIDYLNLNWVSRP